MTATSLFEVRHIHKRFGDQVVLEEINLAFKEGELSGIMGPNGAGKTTCFNVLTGLYKPDRGQVIFAGEHITGLPPRLIAQKGVSRSFQFINLFDEYDYSPYNCFNGTIEIEKNKYRIKHLGNKIPMLYSIKATKK